jgi:tetratricopeptide (TPR) repeat protein
MSLLIKALDKAEKAQEEQKTQTSGRRRAANIANNEGYAREPEVELALESPPQHNVTQEFYTAQYSQDTSARAANVFVAKQPSGGSVSPTVWIAGLGLCGLLAIAGYFYYQLNHLQASPAVVPASHDVVASTPEAQATATIPANTEVTSSVGTEAVAAQPNAVQSNPAQTSANPSSTAGASAAESTEKTSTNPTSIMPPERAAPVLANAETQAVEAVNAPVKKSSTKRLASSLTAREEKIGSKTELSFGAPIASKSASIQISRSNTSQGVNPTLVSAYNAYVAGRDTEAQTLYKKVLQKDTRNVDALLGLGAIAEKQGRQSDALGWYQKVMEIEPRNAIALAAFYGNQPADDNTASSLKNLIAKEPNNANLHADLGNTYAEQSQWAEAQQAYFEAYRLNPTAENAFNLAVGLDQMGKPRLALPYYQQAMVLRSHQPNNAIDEAALAQRISAIQSEQ